MHPLFPSFFPLFVMVIVIIARRPAIHLRRRGAISPETALPVDDLSASDRRRLGRLVAQGTVREAAPGHYYYDADGERARIRRNLPVMLGIVVLLFLVGVGLAMWASHRGAS